MCERSGSRCGARRAAFTGGWWQLFYFLEAVPIWRECSRRGLTHIHAHFTNPSGDVAQLVAQLGAERGGPKQWSWSFSAHGTDIFNDGPGSLAAKVETASLVDLHQRLRPQPADAAGPRGPLGQGPRRPLRPERRVARPTRSRPGPADGELRLLSVGRLEREKGHTVLLDAVARLRDRGTAVQLELVGDGT